MRKMLFVMLLVLTGCCGQPVKDDNPVAAKPVVRERSLREREAAAWREAENEELVSELEKSDPGKWVFNKAEGVILADRHSLDWLHLSFCCLSRMSIFSDGILFTDGSERELSAAHHARLAAFWMKVSRK